MAFRKFLEEFNSFNGEWEEHYYDDETDCYKVKRFSTVDEQVIEHNKQMQNNSIDYSYIGKEHVMYPYASLPNIFVENLLKEGIDITNLQDPETNKRLMRKLEDPEFKYLKQTNKKGWIPPKVKAK